MKKLKIITIVLFWAILAIPIVTFNWKENVVSEIDNRELTNNPFGENYEGNADLTNAIENYVQDRIGFRDQMISSYTLMYDKVFGEMVHPSYTYGKDGYVFGQVTYTEFGEYHIAFADMIKQIQDYCEERDVPFLFLFNPSKTTVLQDKLAEGIHYNNDWVEKFFAELDKRDVNYVNNTDMLTEKTKEGEVVFNQKYNAGHWNDLGAFYGVNQALENLKQFYPQIHINEKGDYDIEEKLNTTLQVSQFPIHEYEPIFEPHYQITDLTEDYRDEIQIDPQHRIFWYYINEREKENNSPKTLVFQGSYMNGMGYKFLANSLGEYIAVHDYQNVINFDYYFNLFRPECVIFEVAEYTVSNNYFDYENMLNMRLNPVIGEFDNLKEEAHDMDECSIDTDRKEKTTAISVEGLPEDTTYAYLQTSEGIIFDLKSDPEYETYSVTIDNSVNLGEYKIITISKDNKKRLYQ